MLALGRNSPPETIRVCGAEYRFARVFKHDFFACTALYEGPAGKVVLKLGRQADILGLPVQRPDMLEVTALGAAALAGLAVGYWKNRGDLAQATSAGTRFEPGQSVDERDALYAGWKRAVERSRDWDRG